MLNKIQKNIKIIVLGEWIHRNIQKDCFLSDREKKQFQWINHPGLNLKSDKVKLGNNPEYNIKFGFIGNQNKWYKFIDTEELSMVEKTITNFGCRVIINSEDFLEEDAYVKNIQESDYIIFLSPKKSYDYACSGIFIDAICYQKPIICLAGGMTNYFFEKYGDIGYKFNTVKELDDNIGKIIQEHSLIYNKQRRNLEKAAIYFSPDYVQKELKKIIIQYD